MALDNYPSSDSSPMLSKIRVGHLTLKNRIMMGPIVTGLEGDKDLSELAQFYSERAKGDTSLITVGGFSFSVLGARYFGQARFDKNSQIAEHQKITETIHNEGGCALFQLSHVGADADHWFALNPTTVNKGDTKLAWRIPKFLIRKTIQKAARTALLAKMAHYDGIELDIAQNHLFNSFATPGLNHRRDEWGGSDLNRFKFAVETVRQIREYVGAEFIISARISLLDFHRFGKTWQETIAFANELVKAGVDLFTFNFGVGSMNIPVSHGLTPEDAWIPFIELFREEVSVPVVFGGNLHSPKLINKILSSNPNSMVEITHALIVDPLWIKKTQYHKERRIISCTMCNNGCTPHQVTHGQRLSCMMNPVLFTKQTVDSSKVSSAKKILVIGAGPAGLAAAVFAARRGHKVTIYEAQDDIGGQVRYCSRIPGKNQFIHLIDMFRKLCNNFDIEIETNHKVTPLEIEDIRTYFDEVVYAAGSTPDWIDIQGAPSSKVYQYPDIFQQDSPPIGNRVAVIGNNNIAIDVATYLVHQSNQIPSRDEWLKIWGIGDPREHRAGVVGMIPKTMTPFRNVALLARNSGSFSSHIQEEFRTFEMQWLRILGIKTYNEVNLDSYDSTSLHISFGKNHEDSIPIPIDHIVICTTPTPNIELANRMNDAGLHTHIIGSAAVGDKDKVVKPILACIREGLKVGCSI